MSKFVPANAFAPILFTDDGIMNGRSELQFASSNALSPITSIVEFSSNVIVEKLLPLNAELPISVKFFPIIIVPKPCRPWPPATSAV